MKKLEVTMRGAEPLKFVPVDVRVAERSPGLEAWLIYWWEENIKKIQTSDWFEAQGDKFLWEPVPSEVETVIELLLEDFLQHIYRYHLIVVPRLMTFFGGNRLVRKRICCLLCLWVFPIGIWGSMNL